MSKPKIAGIVAGVILLVGVLSWMFTAPYLSNQGLGRMPGVLIGGTITPAMNDFSPLNDSVQGPLKFKLSGFPPFVNYLSWVGTPEGVITATRPDNGYWARRVRANGGDGLLRIGDATFEMTATEIHGEDRIAMMRQWAGKTGRGLDESVYEGAEPLRDWKVFFWTPRS
ncbi:MAG: hypothetical protein COA96_10560 [SAR86 cluster bacterium]|uniref:Uncharacterized protein n=1 Tax=SAR86 cluster bacterium TaxID=2030880 RepID=A0A2A5AXN0_9GAMM|nr:MAG: hypothetical protein COA96_10560 [SAR86 cluster bacterium]